MSESSDRSPPMAPTFAEGPARSCAPKRILVLDGAMGTRSRRSSFGEADFRGERFAGMRRDLQGQQRPPDPDAARGDRARSTCSYCRAGADIVETNTFSSHLDRPGRLRPGGARLRAEPRRRAARARGALIAAEQEDGRRRFVAGALGPTNRTASISPDVNDPGYRAVTFDELARRLRRAGRAASIDGGADIILIETIFDTLNAKAAIFATRGGLRRDAACSCR